MRIEIDLLGGFAVRIDGRAVPAAEWRRRQAAALVKLLALTPHRTLHREQVIDALWPDAGLDDAAPRLHKAAHYARRSVGDPRALVLAGDTVSLFPDADVAVDAETFERCARQALAAVDGPGAADVPPRRRPRATCGPGTCCPRTRTSRGWRGHGTGCGSCTGRCCAAPAGGGISPAPTRPTRMPAWPSRGSSPTAATGVGRCGSWSGWSERCAASSASPRVRPSQRCGPNCSPSRPRTRRARGGRRAAAGPRRRARPDRPADRRGERGPRPDAVRVRAGGHRQDRRAAVARPARRRARAAGGRRHGRCHRGGLAVRAGAGGARRPVPTPPGAARRPGRRLPRRDRGGVARHLAAVDRRERPPAVVRQRRRTAAARVLRRRRGARRR